MTSPDAVVLGWVADVLACGEVAVLRGLRNGSSPWLLRCGGREAVLRTGQLADMASFATEVAALRLATGAGVPAPQLLGDDDGTAAGVPLVLTERLPGSSQIPRPARQGPPAGSGLRRRALARCVPRTLQRAASARPADRS